MSLGKPEYVSDLVVYLPESARRRVRHAESRRDHYTAPMSAVSPRLVDIYYRITLNT